MSSGGIWLVEWRHIRLYSPSSFHSITRSYDFLDQIFVIWDVQIARKDKQFKHRATYFDRLCEFEQILIRLNESISLKIYSNDQVLGNFLKSSCIQFGFQTFEHLVYLNNSTCRMLEEKY